MECSDCGASNLDGAERCSACGTGLHGGRADSRDGTGDGSGVSKSTWAIATVVALATIVLVGALLSSGGGGGSGGSVSGDIDVTGSVPGTGAVVPPTSNLATSAPTEPQRQRALGIAKPVVEARFPELVGVEPRVSAYQIEGISRLAVSYEVTATVGTGPSSRVVVKNRVVVTIDESTGEYVVATSY